jgi:hypothetical protein
MPACEVCSARMKTSAGKNAALIRKWNARGNAPRSEMECIFFMTLNPGYPAFSVRGKRKKRPDGGEAGDILYAQILWYIHDGRFYANQSATPPWIGRARNAGSKSFGGVTLIRSSL